MMNNYQTLIKQALAGLALLGLVTLIFGGYLITIGIPRTAARQLYIQAQAAKEDENYPHARELLRQALQVWPEEYIQVELTRIQDK
jgi:hypothetical protein